MATTISAARAALDALVERVESLIDALDRALGDVRAVATTWASLNDDDVYYASMMDATPDVLVDGIYAVVATVESINGTSQTDLAWRLDIITDAERIMNVLIPSGKRGNGQIAWAFQRMAQMARDVANDEFASGSDRAAAKKLMDELNELNDERRYLANLAQEVIERFAALEWGDVLPLK